MKRFFLLVVVTVFSMHLMATNEGKELTALLEKCIAQEEIHPDSIFASLRMLERRALEVKSPEQRAMYNTALGRLYVLRADRAQSAYQRTPAHRDSIQEWSREDYLRASRRCFAEALANKDLLFGMPTRKWLPLVEQHKDEAVFGGNMLYVVWRTMQESGLLMHNDLVEFEDVDNPMPDEALPLPDYADMISYYKSKGLREASFFLDLERADLDWQTRDAELERICEEYADLDIVAHAHYTRIMSAVKNSDEEMRRYQYEELQKLLKRYPKYKDVNGISNAILMTQHPELRLEVPKLCMARDVLKFNPRRRNVKEYTLSLYRLPDNFNEDALTGEETRREVKQNGRLVKSTKVQARPGETPFRIYTDSLHLDIDELGVYALVVDGVKVPLQLNKKLQSDIMIFRATRLMPVRVELADGVRVMVVDSKTGKPQPQVSVDVDWFPQDRTAKDTLREHFTTDAQGIVTIPYSGNRGEFRVAKGDDRFYPACSFNSRSNQDADNTRQINLINTDRAIYRPGQTVQVAVTSIDLKEWDAQAREGRHLTVQLRDADNKLVMNSTFTSDELGMTAFSYDIPQTAKPGNYSIRVNSAYHSIRVEEYKRPTFEVTLDEPIMGDSITFKGRALTYAGVPVRNAQVTGEYQWVEGWWAYYRSMGSTYHVPMHIDTLKTDEDGRFSVSIPCTDLSKMEKQRGMNLRFTVDVLSSMGETQHGQRTATLCSKPLRLYADVNELQDKDRLPKWEFVLIDALGNKVDGTVKVNLFQQSGKSASQKTGDSHDPAKGDVPSFVSSFSIPSNKAVVPEELLHLTSGAYTMKAEVVVNGDTAKVEAERVVLFSMRDEVLPTDTTSWFYVPEKEFSPERPVQVQVGSSLEDVTLYYMVATKGRKLYKDAVLNFSNAMRTITIPYSKEMGEAIDVELFFVKDGKKYSHNFSAVLQKPEAKLEAKWTTFRDKLRPGQQETWKLRLTHLDGTPASANLMATLYDASLDAISRHSLALPVYRDRSIPYIGSTIRYLGNEYVFVDFDLRMKREYAWEFSRLQDKYFQPRMRGVKYLKVTNSNKMMKTAGLAAPRHEIVYSTKGVTAKDFEGLGFTSVDEALQGRIAGLDIVATSDNSGTGAAMKLRGTALNEEAIEVDEVSGLNEPTDWSALRTNFCETAFFYPQLRTDKEGEVSIEFTLPESLTRWHLLGVAHDKQMFTANIDESIVAQKELMAQLFLPRFLRVGDKAVLTASIQNVSENTDERGMATFEILDARTEKVLMSKKVKFDLKAQEDVVFHFDFDVKDSQTDLICRWVANGKACSDGEQHLIPVLADRETLVRTKALWLYEKGTTQLDLQHLFPKDASERKLTVEYTTHPIWVAIQSLPGIMNPTHWDVLNQASAYYASTLCKYLREHIEGVDKVLPLDVDSLERSRVRIIKKVLELQLPNGAFCWFPGMLESEYLTREVAFLMARLVSLTDGQDEDSRSILDDAIRYMRSNLKKTTTISNSTLKHLYIVSLAGKSLDDNEKRLLKELSKTEDRWSLEDRALASIVLCMQDKNRATNRMMDGVEKYLVGTPETGRYIDYPSGSFTSIDYKIRIHTQIMEAVKTVRPKDKALWQGMQQWLLQEKRTTDWTTPVNTVDAVYALLCGGRDELKDEAQDVLDVKGKRQIQRLTSPDNRKGYLKTVVDVENPQTLNITKRSEGESWGAVYAEFEQQIDSVHSAWQGINIRREWSTVRPKVGERVHIRYVITATRDYDYVLLHGSRSANAEPAMLASGYEYRNGLSFYRSVRDNGTDYYIEHLPKGTYVLEEDVMVEREGLYSTGITKIECLYAPEFKAYTGNVKVESTKK